MFIVPAFAVSIRHLYEYPNNTRTEFELVEAGNYTYPEYTYFDSNDNSKGYIKTYAYRNYGRSASFDSIVCEDGKVKVFVEIDYGGGTTHIDYCRVYSLSGDMPSEVSYSFIPNSVDKMLVVEFSSPGTVFIDYDGDRTQGTMYSEGAIVVSVSKEWFDTEPPVLDLSYDEQNWYNQIVGITIPVTATDNKGITKIEFMISP